MKDYILCIVLRGLSFILRFLPLEAWLFVARGWGWFYYYLAGKRNRRAYAHLRRAFPAAPGAALNKIIQGMYQRIAQNAFETLYVPWMDEKFVKEHVRVSGQKFVDEALKEKHGIIFLAVHAGSWELSNIACAMFFPAEGVMPKADPPTAEVASGGTGGRYAMFARPQSKFKRLNDFLNQLRESKGCRVIAVTELKKMVEHLNANNILGVVADHGGKEGVPVEFFGKLAPTPVGAVRLAQKLGCKIILAYMHRLRGSYHEMVFKPYVFETSGDDVSDIKENLTRINKVFEQWVLQYPQEYIWFYKRWKHGPQRDFLVLSDGRAGHLKQSLSVAQAAKSFIPDPRVRVVDIKYQEHKPYRLLSLIGFLFGARVASACLSYFLSKECYEALNKGVYDCVVSAGSSLAVFNLALAYENNAKAIAVMRPGIFSFRRFDLVIMPEHDHPPKKKNCLEILGSLNTVDADSMETDFESLKKLRPALLGLEAAGKPKIGVLIGGDSKNYKLLPEIVLSLCQQLKKVLDDCDGILLVTTSRRTPEHITAIFKQHLKGDSRCKLFVAAAQDNPPGVVGGIFYLSDVVLVSGESISMVSEAAASGKVVIVFEPHRRNEKNKVLSFLKKMADVRYIRLVKFNEIFEAVTDSIRCRPQTRTLSTKTQVTEVLKTIL